MDKPSRPTHPITILRQVAEQLLAAGWSFDRAWRAMYAAELAAGVRDPSWDVNIALIDAWRQSSRPDGSVRAG